MSVVEKPKKSSPLGRAIERSRGAKSLTPIPPQKSQQKASPQIAPLSEDEKAKRVFEIQRKNVQKTLDNYKNSTSVANIVAGFNKRLEVADQAANDQAWKRARDLILLLKNDLTELPQLVSDERERGNRLPQAAQGFNRPHQGVPKPRLEVARHGIAEIH